MSLSQITLSDSNDYSYRYWDWGKTPRRDDFQFAALQLALDKTIASHGAFSAVRIKKEFSTLRSRREVNRDQFVNVRAGPWLPNELSATEDNRRIPLPILENLLGYRQLVIRQNDLAVFNEVRSLDQLQQLVAGQGRGWQDVDIYEANDYKVAAEGQLTALLPMLHNRRFDYLPLSVIEIELIMAESSLCGQDLMIAPNIVIYYPLPVIFYVSNKRPELAERLEQGLILAREDGSLDALREKHFSQEMAVLRDANNRFFVLKNPFIPPQFVSSGPLFARPLVVKDDA